MRLGLGWIPARSAGGCGGRAKSGIPLGVARVHVCAHTRAYACACVRVALPTLPDSRPLQAIAHDGLSSSPRVALLGKGQELSRVRGERHGA